MAIKERVEIFRLIAGAATRPNGEPVYTSGQVALELLRGKTIPTTGGKIRITKPAQRSAALTARLEGLLNQNR
jgi:hypothetical protein